MNTIQTEEQDPQPSNYFSAFCQGHRDGDFLTELSDKLQELDNLVRERVGVGTMTIKIAITPGGGGMFTTVDEISIKPPKEEKRATAWWMTEEGLLVRHDPSQKELELRTVKSPDAPMREIQSPEQRLRAAGAE